MLQTRLWMGAILIVLTLASTVFKFEVIQWILTRAAAVLAFALIVIFQPELRTGLARLGSNRLFSLYGRRRLDFLERFADAVVHLAGALTAFGREGYFSVNERGTEALVQAAWEALEHAGLAPERLAGSATGVFVGVCNSDYIQRVLGRGIETIDAYLASGNALSVAAGTFSNSVVTAAQIVRNCASAAGSV